MKELLIGLTIILFTPSTSLAMYSYHNNGTYYNEKYNQHGLRLTSNNEVIYLGKSCDAFSPTLGKGYWNQSNGGILVTFYNGVVRGFPKQSTYINKCNS